MKVTDLDKWAMGQVWLPYYPSLPEAYAPDTGARLHTDPKRLREHIKQLAGEDFLMGTITALDKHPKFAKSVTNRLDLIGDYFPSYLHHPLVDWFWTRGHMLARGQEPGPHPATEFAQEELIQLWCDLDLAHRASQAREGELSLQMENLIFRIQKATAIVGPVHWHHIPITFISSGAYKWLAELMGIDYTYPTDEEYTHDIDTYTETLRSLNP